MTTAGGGERRDAVKGKDGRETGTFGQVCTGEHSSKGKQARGQKNSLQRESGGSPGGT